MDPILPVPEWLLPDESDLLEWESGKRTKGLSAKAKGKEPANVSLKTRSGDICADIWICEGCSEMHRTREKTLRESDNNHFENSASSSSAGTESFWQQWNEKEVKSSNRPRQRPEIEVESDTGTVTLRLVRSCHFLRTQTSHAPQHTLPSQQFILRVASSGPISIGVPRSFYGHVYTYTSAGLSSATQLEKEGRPGVMLQNLVSRLPVQFSPDLEPVVRPRNEQRWTARAEYFVGDYASRGWSHVNTQRVFRN